MKIEDRYHYNLREDKLGITGAVLSLGVSVLLDVDSMGWICTFTDKITNIEITESDREKQIAFDKAYMGIKVAVMNFEVEQAYQRKQQELEERRFKEERQKQLEYERALKKQNGNTDDGSEAIIKIVIYAALIIGAIWLLFNIAIPLVILNASIICLIYAFFNKEKGSYLILFSALAFIYLIFDYKIGWLTKILTTNASFFTKIIPIIFYLNLTSGIISIIIYIIFFFDEEKENNIISLKNIKNKTNRVYSKINNSNNSTILDKDNYTNSTIDINLDEIINVYSENILYNKNIQCNTCNNICNVDDKFCEGCGGRIDSLTETSIQTAILVDLNTVCNSCNNIIKPDDNFCENCGNKLK